MTKELFERQKDFILQNVKKLKSFGFDVKVVSEEGVLNKDNEVKIFIEADRFCEIVYQAIDLERIVNILKKYRRMQNDQNTSE